MRSNRRSASLVAAVVGALILALTQPSIAFAAIKATSNNILTVNSGSVKVFAKTTKTLTGSGVLTVNSVPNNSTQTFFINNGGNLGAGQFKMTLTLSGITFLRYCPANIDFSGTQCATLPTASAPTTVSVTGLSGSERTYPAIPASSFIAFQYSRTGGSNTLTVSTSVSLSNFSGSVTNS